MASGAHGARQGPGKVSVGQSCVRFKRLDALNLDVVEELCRRAAELVAAGRFAM